MPEFTVTADGHSARAHRPAEARPPRAPELERARVLGEVPVVIRPR